jgi:hypothetical protein
MLPHPAFLLVEMGSFELFSFFAMQEALNYDPLKYLPPKKLGMSHCTQRQGCLLTKLILILENWVK